MSLKILFAYCFIKLVVKIKRNVLFQQKAVTLSYMMESIVLYCYTTYEKTLPQYHNKDNVSSEANQQHRNVFFQGYTLCLGWLCLEIYIAK